ncbi:MAG: dihydroorotase [Opitutaceae bacterium]|nr:dihydroorotase [Cytophagales bacterium]
MKILLKKAKIISNQVSINGLVMDILVEDGKIVAIEEVISDSSGVIVESDNLCVSVGWFDMGCKLGDPGYEYKEDITSGTNAAMAGGFTELACLPNTKPCIQNKENIYYIHSKSKELPVNIHVIAAATENLQGKQMSEILDLMQAGAVAFSDGGHTIEDSGMMVRLIQYLSQVNGILMVHSDDKSLSLHGVMHEGEQSVFLGQKGIPSVSEDIIVDRNLSLLKYTQGSLHFSKISTSGSVEKIRKAKAEGLKVTCDVAVANLVYDDGYLVSFDTNYKINPPLRSKNDKEELWKGLKDGTIDVIVTDHAPQDEESKNLEFDQADFGMIQLETAYSLLNISNSVLELSELIDLISRKPRELLNLKVPQIKVGEEANLTVFDPGKNWIYDKVKSKSRNSPEIGNTLTGKVLAIFNKNQFIDLRN